MTQEYDWVPTGSQLTFRYGVQQLEMRPGSVIGSARALTYRAFEASTTS